MSSEVPGRGSFQHADLCDPFNSAKVYKSQFRRWGIRKNLKRHEALELATAQESSSVFWPGDRDEQYADRIDRHLRNSKRRSNQASSRAQTWMAIRARTPPRRLRAPDTLEKVEAASYYLRIYITGNHETDMWFKTGRFFEEQEAFSSLFVRGLERLSRNDQQQLAFKDINRAFDYLKQIVERNHPMVYMKLMAAVAAFAQYPKSEICLKVCRLLSDHVRKLTLIVHGPHHPLNHIWGETLHVASAEGAGSFVLGVAVSGVRKCMANRPRHALGAFDIAQCVPSVARGQDEASLRGNLVAMAPHPDLLPEVQETRLALSELMLNQGRIAEGYHYYTEAIAFQDDDPVRRAGKLFWAAELKWRSGNTWGSLDTLKSALQYAEIDSMSDRGNGNARKLKQEIEDALRHKHDLLVLKETSKPGQARRRCPVIHF